MHKRILGLPLSANLRMDVLLCDPVEISCCLSPPPSAHYFPGCRLLLASDEPMAAKDNGCRRASRSRSEKRKNIEKEKEKTRFFLFYFVVMMRSAIPVER